MAVRIEEMDGMFVGLLDDDEIAILNQAISDGKARRAYVGAAGFMGLAKVELLHPIEDAKGGE